MSPMLQSPLAPPHRLTLTTSRILMMLLIVGHLVVMAGLLAARPEGSTVLFLPWVLWSLHRGLGQHALRYAAQAAVGLDVDLDGSLWLRCREGGRQRVLLQGSSTVHPWVVVLNLRRAPSQPGPVRRGQGAVVPETGGASRSAGRGPGIRVLPAWGGWGNAQGRSLSFSVIIPRDACARQEFRRLRAWLLWGSTPEA